MIDQILNFLESRGADSLTDAFGAIIASIIIGATIWFWSNIPKKWRVALFLSMILGAGLFLWVSWPNRNPVTVSIASSSTKQEWMEAAARQFNGLQYKTKSGRLIIISYDEKPGSSGKQVRHVISGDSKNHILNNFISGTFTSKPNGKVIQPDVWSPGTHSWVDQFKREQPKLISKRCEKTIYSPIGIAMARSRAEALGWPETAIGFKDLIDLARDPKKNAVFRRREWDDFYFGHPNPEYSNAGLLFMVALSQAVLGKKPDDITIYSNAIKNASEAIQSRTTRYDTISTNLLKLILDGDLHATWAFEEGVLRYNRQLRSDDQEEIVFIFPKEGTFWSEHPYCILDQAPWVKKDSDKIEAAETFRKFLLSRPIQELAVQKLLRPLNTIHYPAQHTLSKDPRLSRRPAKQFPSPNAVVSQRAIDLFWQTKRKVSVLLILDRSGSMNDKVSTRDTKFKLAKSAIENFIKNLRTRDRVGINVFNDEINPIWSIQERKRHWPEGNNVNITPKQGPLKNKLEASGGTALYHAVCDGFKQLHWTKIRDKKNGENRIYGMILLSDGQNDDEQYIQRIEGLWACIKPYEKLGSDRIRVNTIAFGNEKQAKEWALEEIAGRTKGKICVADPPHKLEDCYREINRQ